MTYILEERAKQTVITVKSVQGIVTGTWKINAKRNFCGCELQKGDGIQFRDSSIIALT